MAAPTVRTIIVALALGIALVGCGPAAPGDRTEAPTVSGAWVRPPMGPDRPAAGYLVVQAAADASDALIGASCELATSVEIHETTSGEGGMAGMHAVDRIEIPSGGTIVLEPGGYHLMLMGLTDELVPGSTVELVLTFERAGEVTVVAEVRQG
jgi:copper(I)-binding protein